jgi:hypothetical protein
MSLEISLARVHPRIQRVLLMVGMMGPMRAAELGAGSV